MEIDYGPRYQLLQKHLGGNDLLSLDDLSIVLKAHLILEIFLDEVLCSYYKNEKAKDMFENLNITFLKKVELIEKFNLLKMSGLRISQEESIKILRNINRLRNKFAHDLTSKLSNCDDILNHIFPHFEDSITKIVTNKSHQKEIHDLRRVKFGLCVASLGGMFDRIIDNPKMPKN